MFFFVLFWLHKSRIYSGQTNKTVGFAYDFGFFGCFQNQIIYIYLLFAQSVQWKRDLDAKKKKHKSQTLSRDQVQWKSDSGERLIINYSHAYTFDGHNSVLLLFFFYVSVCVLWSASHTDAEQQNKYTYRSRHQIYELKMHISRSDAEFCQPKNASTFRTYPAYALRLIWTSAI